MGNTEILLKQALMAVQERTGADVELIRSFELQVKPCTGCEACMKSLLAGGDGTCVQKGDDMAFLYERVAECDAVIVGVPTYELQPPGLLLQITN